MARPNEDGYATPSAAVISMAIATVVAALVGRSVAEVRLARAELDRTEVEYAMAGAHEAALLSIASSSNPPPYRWNMPSNGHAYKVIAEPERAKLSLQAAAGLDNEQFARLSVSDPDGVRARLQALMVRGGLVWAADASTAQGWRACAASMASTYGIATVYPHLTYSEPEAGKQTSLWRAGEAWRIAVTNSDGWRDERIIRFTGNGLNPAAVIGRRISRGWKETTACEMLLNAA